MRGAEDTRRAAQLDLALCVRTCQLRFAELVVQRGGDCQPELADRRIAHLALHGQRFRQVVQAVRIVARQRAGVGDQQRGAITEIHVAGVASEALCDGDAGGIIAEHDLLVRLQEFEEFALRARCIAVESPGLRQQGAELPHVRRPHAVRTRE